MIKKYIINFILSFVFCMPAFANSYQNDFNYDYATDISNKLKAVVGISPYDLDKVLSDYVFIGDEKEMVKTFKMYWNPHNGEISFDNLLQVCIAGGITECQQNPSNPRCDKNTYSAGDDQCMLFMRKLIGAAKDRTRSSRGSSNSKAFTERSCKKVGGTWAKDILDSGYHCVGKDGKLLKFSNACSDGYGHCVRDFANVQVQELSGFELVNLWGQRNHLQLTCEQDYYNLSASVAGKIATGLSDTVASTFSELTAGRPSQGKDVGQDYIRCSANGDAYEFEFDDLNETMDNDNYYGIAAGVCALFGIESSSMSAYGECRTMDRAKCAEIREVAQRFGFYTSTSGNDYGYCAFNPSVVDGMSLRTAFGLNPRAFEGQVNVAFTRETKNMVRDYVESHLKNQGITLTSFDCNAGYANYGKNDNIWTCYVNGKPVDFVFDDVSEYSTQTHRAGLSQIACQQYQGQSDGKNCYGLDQTNCATLGQKLQQRGLKGTYYDEVQGGCIILEGEINELQNVVLEVAGGVVLTVVTGGSGPVLVAIGLSVGTDLAIKWVNDWQREIPYEDYMEFEASANTCLTADNKTAQIFGLPLQEYKKSCLAFVLREYAALIEGSLGKMAPTIQNKAHSLINQIAEIIGDEEAAQIISESEIPTYKSNRNYAMATVLGVSLLLNPEKIASKADDFVELATKAGTHLDDIVDAKKATSSILNSREVITSKGHIIKIPDYDTAINPNVIQDDAVRQIYQNAYDAEKIITDDMVEITYNAGGKLSGLEYRMKTPESMLGKISRDRAAGEVAEGVSDADVASRFSDLVRYTQTGDVETLSKQITQTLHDLENKGYRINKFKNRFDNPVGGYKDIMIQLEHIQTGQKVELQFNTPKNLSIKEEGHKFYEITRDFSKSQSERDAAQKAMEELYEQLEIPKNITGLTY